MYFKNTKLFKLRYARIIEEIIKGVVVAAIVFFLIALCFELSLRTIVLGG